MKTVVHKGVSHSLAALPYLLSADARDDAQLRRGQAERTLSAAGGSLYHYEVGQTRVGYLEIVLAAQVTLQVAVVAPCP